MSISTNTKEILKIKEIFPNLQANKIKNIQKIINNNNKLKPKLNITTNSLLRKQVIISMSNDNKLKFIYVLFQSHTAPSDQLVSLSILYLALNT